MCGLTVIAKDNDKGKGNVFFFFLKSLFGDKLDEEELL